MSLIPIMDDPLGRHWRQPGDIRLAPMDDRHVLLTARQLEGLPEYSATRPTGVYPGKCWKYLEENDPHPDGRRGAVRLNMSFRTLLFWYGPENDEGCCPIMFREVLVA